MNNNHHLTKLVRFLLWPSMALLVSCHSHQGNHYQGYVEGELMYMAAPYAGNLFTLNVHRGQTLKKGAPLFSLDPEPEKSQLAQVSHQYVEAKNNLENLRKGQRETILSGIIAQINQAKAQVDLAQIRLSRQQELYKKNATPKDTLDEAATTYKADLQQLRQLQSNLSEAELGSRTDVIAAQESAVKAAQANLSQTQWILQQKALNSPVNATVFDTYYHEGEWVATGKPILSLLAPQYIRFIFFIPETELGNLQLGQKLRISCDSCKKSYVATVSFISPQAEYMPPLVYSRDNNYNLVFRIKADPKLEDAALFHPGQPVYVDTGH